MPPECEESEDSRGPPEKTSCIDGRIKDPISFAVASTFLGRRAMVNKFKCNEFTRKLLPEKVEPPSARTFSEPKCQSHVATWYLFYRWLICIAWVVIIICSIFEIGSKKPLLSFHTWPIYLTNWDLLLGVNQAILGALLVSRRWKLQQDSMFNPSSLRLGTMDRFYWFLYVVTTTIAIGVTIYYWCTVYDPKIHQIDSLNIMLHVCNSILMLTDLCITSIPFRLEHVWWCLSFVIVYLIFSVIYYSAGGLDKLGRHYIYKMLDWNKPGRTLLICLGGLIFVAALHSAICLLAKFKDRVYRRYDLPSINNDRSPPVKQGDIV